LDACIVNDSTSGAWFMMNICERGSRSPECEKQWHQGLRSDKEHKQSQSNVALQPLLMTKAQ